MPSSRRISAAHATCPACGRASCTGVAYASGLPSSATYVSAAMAWLARVSVSSRIAARVASASVAALLLMNASASPACTGTGGTCPSTQPRSPVSASAVSASGARSPVPIAPSRCTSGSAPVRTASASAPISSGLIPSAR